MLLGLLNSVYSYYKQIEDISMLDVLIVLYERLTGVKTDKKKKWNASSKSSQQKVLLSY